MDTVTIRFIDNQGGGYADDMTVRAGITVAEVFAEKKGTGCDPSSYSIRLNNAQCRGSDVLQDGDIVSITPLDLKAF